MEGPQHTTLQSSHTIGPESPKFEVSPEFLTVVGIVGFSETFLKFPFVLLSETLVPETVDIQPNDWMAPSCGISVVFFTGHREKSGRFRQTRRSE